MGLNFLSSSSMLYSKNDDTSPNPNKFNFEILKCIYSIDNYKLILVHYPDCTTFNGEKLMIIKGLVNPNELDPHFLEDGKVIARFRPDFEGKTLGLAVMELLK